MKAKNILLTASLCAGIGLATLVAQTGDQQQHHPDVKPHEHDGHDEHDAGPLESTKRAYRGGHDRGGARESGARTPTQSAL